MQPALAIESMPENSKYWSLKASQKTSQQCPLKSTSGDSFCYSDQFISIVKHNESLQLECCMSLLSESTSIDGVFSRKLFFLTKAGLGAYTLKITAAAKWSRDILQSPTDKPGSVTSTMDTMLWETRVMTTSSMCPRTCVGSLIYCFIHKTGNFNVSLSVIMGRWKFRSPVTMIFLSTVTESDRKFYHSTSMKWCIVNPFFVIEVAYTTAIRNE